MPGTEVLTMDLMLVHRVCRLVQHCPVNRKAVTRASCKVCSLLTFLSRATISNWFSVAPQFPWSTAVCLEAPQQIYKERLPAPVSCRLKRPQLCVWERATRAIFLRLVVICTEAQVCEQVSPILQPLTTALSLATPLHPLDPPLLLASTLATSPETHNPLSSDQATGLAQVL